MGYRKYGEAEYEKLKKQHNIMALVGNGFDIQIMHDFAQPSDTRYETFYHYLKFRSFDEENVIVKQMEALLEAGKKNWSDLEGAIREVLANGGSAPDDVYNALRPIQREFSSFLNQTVPSTLLDDLGARVVKEERSLASLSQFIYDIEDPEEYSKFEFPRRTAHFDLYNFLFVNFNYTSLLDGYVYLDQNQFDPRPYKTSDRNFEFLPNPRDHAATKRYNKETIWQSNIQTEVIHPHGVQDIPRSLLIGIDAEPDFDNATDPNRKLVKPYWAQNDVRYRHFFEDTELFIVFGCSLGESDGWWWRSIAAALDANPDAELMIYRRQRSQGAELSEEDVRDQFISAADCAPAQAGSIRDRIRIVLYEEGSDRKWLNTSP